MTPIREQVCLRIAERMDRIQANDRTVEVPDVVELLNWINE